MAGVSLIQIIIRNVLLGNCSDYSPAAGDDSADKFDL